jgi:hypothetical protein
VFGNRTVRMKNETHHRTKTSRSPEEVASHPGENARLKPKNGIETVLCQKMTETD